MHSNSFCSGACLLDICCDDDKQSDEKFHDNVDNETIGIIETCIHAFHATCIQVMNNNLKHLLNL